MSSLKPDHTTKSHKSLEADSYKKSAAGLADHSSGGAKRGGGGSHNWGSVDDEIRDAVREHEEENQAAEDARLAQKS